MKPVAFRVYDFKSIIDSGWCILSGDNITVLAGQNESGKTALLTALRDFDLSIGTAPQTPDYRPDDRFDAQPRVSVLFRINPTAIKGWLEANGSMIPAAALDHLSQTNEILITRDLDSGTFSVDEELRRHWDAETTVAESSITVTNATLPVGQVPAVGEDFFEEKKPESLNQSKFAEMLHPYWPSFVYFDAFEDYLPRSVAFADLKPPAKPDAPGQIVKPKAAQPVMDYITLSGIDTEIIEKNLASDKNLSNYLRTRSASITGDFLSYWKQRVEGEQTLDLAVKHHRDIAGALHLAFYVRDGSDHHPEQRSKGFLWFLSFYLKLAAARRRTPDRERLLLIDEPGTFLHARAQQDVLHLLEDRLASADQIIYSTHSPFLIPIEKLHRLRIIIKAGREGTLAIDRLTHPLLRDGFQDTLSPILMAIGLDIRGALTFVKKKNLLVEGISDHYYITAWSSLFTSTIHTEFNIFPGYGAMSVTTLASLFVGWGLDFLVVLDRDEMGTAARQKLVTELHIKEESIVQPKNAKGIEDLLSHEDFRELVKALDPTFTIEVSETPFKAIKRQHIDKALLGRKYSERVSSGQTTLTKKSSEGIQSFLAEIEDRWKSMLPEKKNGSI